MDDEEKRRLQLLQLEELINSGPLSQYTEGVAGGGSGSGDGQVDIDSLLSGKWYKLTLKTGNTFNLQFSQYGGRLNNLLIFVDPGEEATPENLWKPVIAFQKTNIARIEEADESECLSVQALTIDDGAKSGGRRSRKKRTERKQRKKRKNKTISSKRKRKSYWSNGKRKFI
jgi:hypothetical protein